MSPRHPNAIKINVGSKRVLDALRPRAAPYRAWAKDLPGFGVHIAVSGRKTWCVFYRHHGMKRAINLGDLRKVPPAVARRLALEAFGAVASGRDPLAERQAARDGARTSARARRAAATLTDVAEDYFHTLMVLRSPGWAERARRLYETHAAPELGELKASEVTVADVRSLVQDLHETPTTANRLRSVLHAILTRATSDGARPAGAPNPAAGVTKYVETARDRYLSPDEWRRLATAIAKERAALADARPGDTRLHQIDAVVLLALCGGRKESVTVRRWSDVDHEGRFLKVDPPHKGASRVVLGETALALLRRWYAERGSEDGYIFPGRAGGPVATLYRVWGSLVTRARLEDFHIHDLRRSYAVVAGDVGVSEHLIGGLLNHAVRGVTQRYARRSDPALIDAASRTAAEVARRLGLDGLADAQVLPMHGRGAR